MESLMKKLNKPLVLITAFSIVGAGSSFTVAPDQAEAKSWKYELGQAENLKYPERIVAGVFKTLRKETRGPLPFSEALLTIDKMNKVEVMDNYLNRTGKKVKPEEIRDIVSQVYGIDLNTISELGAGKQTSAYSDHVFEKVEKGLKADVSVATLMSLSKKEIMDLYWAGFEGQMDGADMRRMINEVFGINLEGIANLEGSGVSLFSKEQWISQYERDLFVVHTGFTDVDVWVYPTKYFKEQTGLTELPQQLKNKLRDLGFSYNDEVDGYYYSNPTGESVPDDFKGKTLGAIIGVANEGYSELK
ncbi:hypothetical protein [Halobacillus litoralis]|uniref:hypothetical protein n=1 Tax=Halobacillus litoralis TaxID=45668 RepID=UPI0024930B89|nr:hypothetical protein [Halobacillus litoralis]